MKNYFSILVASLVCAAIATVNAHERSGSRSAPEHTATLVDVRSTTGATGDTIHITTDKSDITSVTVPTQVLAPLHEVKQTRFDSAQWIKTTVDINASGHLDGRIHVWSKHFFVGFTGTALIYLRDAEGNILFRVGAPFIGVNGEAFGRSDVTRTWGTGLPAIVREHVASIEIVNSKSPQSHDLAKLNIASIAAAYSRYAK